MRRLRASDHGAGIVEYALVVVLVALTSLAAVKTLGDDTSDSFEAVAVPSEVVESESEEEPDLTPSEKWEKAKADYSATVNEAKAQKSADMATAKKTYKDQLKENKSLPKAERKAANKAAKQKYDADRGQINQTYTTTVTEAKAARDAATAEYNASK